ncbi:hypothetical protein AA313_de0207483 [Arthrobotrys entomopaga]|nr:hypothetical protein AA313_de0207483 [Arthrobotrys entomopaga]
MMPQAGPYYPPPQGHHPQMHHPQQYMSPHPQHPIINPSVMQTPARPPPQRGGGQQTPGHYAMPTQMIPTPTGPSTSKRQRTSQSMPSAGPSNPVLAAAAIDSVEDEEDTSRGDVLDHINPREISTQRYKQHHEWFEEVFTSPYASSNIEPGSIGIEKLGTWLKPLIDGALDKDGKPVPGKSYQDALQSMNQNFEKIIAENNAEMEEMERQHKLRIAEIKGDRITELFKELRYAKPTRAEIEFGLVLPHPIDAADFRQSNRTVDEIVAEFEQIAGSKIVDGEMVRCYNPQPEVAAYEETLRQEAAAAAAAAAAANTLGLNGANGEKEQETDKMAGVGPSESTSPDNARYLVPVVIEKTDVTGSSSAQPPTTTTATISTTTATTTAPAAATVITNEDTPMTDAEPMPATTSTALPPPTAPVQAASTTAPTSTSTPGGLSGTPVSPFVIPSPSPAAGFTPQSQSRNATPGIPTPLPQTAEPGLTPNPSQADQMSIAATAITPGKTEEPPTVPGEDDLLEGITGGEDDTFDFGGGGAAEAMDLLGAGESFADEFM